MSLFVIFEISGLFVKTLIPHDKYSLRYMENLPQPIQMELSRKQKLFPHFFSAFPKYTSNFEHLETKISLIVYIFPKLETTKDVFS